jgi:hypothetical protein
MPRRLVHTLAIKKLGYPYEEEVRGWHTNRTRRDLSALTLCRMTESRSSWLFRKSRLTKSSA